MLRLVMIMTLLVGWNAFTETDDEITKKASKVKIYRKSDPPDSCKEIGPISTPHIALLSETVRENMLRRLAAIKGANGLQVVDLKGDPITGVIFNCK